MKSILLFITIGLVFFSLGCDNDTDTGSSGPGKTIPPKQGSVYMYNNTPIDTNGVKMIDSSYDSIDSVSQTGTVYGGKSNVIVMSSRDLKTGLVTNSYLHYEDNGDISEYVGGSLLSFLGISYPDWITYTIQSHETVSMKVADTTITLSSLPVKIVVRDTIAYMSTATFAVSKTSLGVFNVKHVTNYAGSVTLLIFPVPFNMAAITTIAFAPAIGYYADKTIQPMKIPFGIFPSVNGSEKTLISYTIK